MTKCDRRWRKRNAAIWWADMKVAVKAVCNLLAQVFWIIVIDTSICIYHRLSNMTESHAKITKSRIERYDKRWGLDHD